jgi:hypothetical protein
MNWTMVCAAGMAALLGGAALRAQDAVADGTLSMEGVAVTIRHAAAFGQRGDDAVEYLHVFLTDVALPTTALDDGFERDEWFHTRAAQGVVVVLTPDREVLTTRIYHTATSATGMSIAGGIRFEATRFEPGTVAGRVASESDWASYDITFSVPVHRRAPPTAEALASEPAQRVREFVEAATKGDRVALLRTLLAADATALDGDDADEVMEMLQDAELDAYAIVFVLVEGDEARVILESDDGSGRLRFELEREADGWRIRSPL